MRKLMLMIYAEDGLELGKPDQWLVPEQAAITIRQRFQETHTNIRFNETRWSTPQFSTYRVQGTNNETGDPEFLGLLIQVEIDR